MICVERFKSWKVSRWEINDQGTGRLGEAVREASLSQFQQLTYYKTHWILITFDTPSSGSGYSRCLIRQDIKTNYEYYLLNTLTDLPLYKEAQ